MFTFRVFSEDSIFTNPFRFFVVEATPISHRCSFFVTPSSDQVPALRYRFPLWLPSPATRVIEPMPLVPHQPCVLQFNSSSSISRSSLAYSLICPESGHCTRSLSPSSGFPGPHPPPGAEGPVQLFPPLMLFVLVETTEIRLTPYPRPRLSPSAVARPSFCFRCSQRRSASRLRFCSPWIFSSCLSSKKEWKLPTFAVSPRSRTSVPQPPFLPPSRKISPFRSRFFATHVPFRLRCDKRMILDFCASRPDVIFIFCFSSRASHRSSSSWSLLVYQTFGQF